MKKNVSAFLSSVQNFFDTSANNACQNYYICASNLSVLHKINARKKAAAVIIVLPNIVALFYPKTLITTIHLGSPWQ